MTAVIETDRLCKRYGDARGIEDLTLGLTLAAVGLATAGALLFERRDVG